MTLCDPMDYTVHGILQARLLEWVAFPFSRIFFFLFLFVPGFKTKKCILIINILNVADTRDREKSFIISQPGNAVK